MPRLPRPPHLTRDSILFIAGLAGLTREAVWEGAERPTLIIAFLAMMGLPAFLRQDEKSAAHRRSDPAPPEKDSNEAVPP